MARFIDNSLPYFPMYCDFFSNRVHKFTAIKGEYGNDGVLFYIYMQCEIFKVGYYIDLNEDKEFISDAAGVLGISSNLIRQVLKFLCERSLIDLKLFTQDNIITSKEFQRQYQHGMSKRNLKRAVEVDGRLWLLDEKETEGLIKVRPFSEHPEKKVISSEEKPINSGEKPTMERNAMERNAMERNAMEGNGAAASPPSPSPTSDLKTQLIEMYGRDNVADYEQRFDNWKAKRGGNVKADKFNTIAKWLKEDGVRKPVNNSSIDIDNYMENLMAQYRQDG